MAKKGPSTRQKRVPLDGRATATMAGMAVPRRPVFRRAPRARTGARLDLLGLGEQGAALGKGGEDIRRGEDRVVLHPAHGLVRPGAIGVLDGDEALG